MVTFTDEVNLFNLKADLYVITVNTIGVMGAGVAKAFKQRYYDLYCLYRTDCIQKKLQTGKPLIYQADDDLRFMMFPTKQNWINPSQYDWVAQGLYWMVEQVGKEIQPDWVIGMPPLGCGHGKLDWGVVAPMIKHICSPMPNQILCTKPVVGAYR